MPNGMTGASADRCWDYAAIGGLIEPLSARYQGAMDVRRIVTDAGLEDLPRRVSLEGPPLQVWWAVLVTAREQPGWIEAIVARAVAENTDDERFVLLREAPAEPTPADIYHAALTGLESLPAEPTAGSCGTPLVDRREAVALLRAELEQVDGTGSGSVLLLLGDSGVGKSRLAECAAGEARERAMLVLDAQCLGTAGDALQPLRNALKSHRGPPTLQELLDEAAAELRQYAPFLSSFLRLDGAAEFGPRLGGSTDQGVHEALTAVLLALAGRHGLCLVVDDLTDADQETLHFVDYFRRKVAANRVLTILTVKQDLLEPELRDLLDRWVAEGCRVSNVTPLEDEDAAELVAGLWRGPPLDDEKVAGIVALAGGNPFFIEQYLQERAESESLDGPVPDRVEAVLRRRVRRLDDDTRAFLDAASVALEASNLIELVAHIADVGPAQASRLLRKAVEARCLAEDAARGVTFVQELLRRVVYEHLGAHTRLFMHGRAAEWLEASGLLASAAHHFERAGRTEDLVRTALQGAASAEHAGVYREALQLYERALPFSDLDEVGPRLAKAYLVVGRWTEAEELLDRLPADELDVRLLRAELFSVRGDYNRALEEMEFVVQAPSARRLETLVRLADINLYLGEFATAGDYATEALAEAASPTAVARCRGAVGAVAFFAGRIDEGEREFVEAMSVLPTQPVEDPYVYTMILGNLGFASEVRGQWATARRLHEESLARRREVADARGVLQSLHAVARSDFGLGADDGALEALEEAQGLAASLGERLEEGKIEHTYAELDLRRGEPALAVRRAENALRRFREAGTAYDITHARFTLARAFAANGAHRRSVEEGANARGKLARKGFGLLAMLFPQLAFPYDERLAGGLLGYVCGDAVGLPWEGKPADDIDSAQVPLLPAPCDWPRGSTSDDTALTILVAEHLVASGGPDAAGFLALLAEQAPSIKGLGPSTTAAVEHFRRTGAPQRGDGNTNGALMRSLPIGWALSLDRATDRRAWTLELSRTTHQGAEACCAALVGAACAAWAIEGASPALLLDVAREEVAVARQSLAADGRIDDMLAALDAGTWQPDADSVDLDPYETLTRALWCTVNEPSLEDALLTAVRIGGDTDTVAALVGGLLGCRLTPAAVREQLPWSGDVTAPDEALLGHLASGLAGLRTDSRG